MKRFIFFAISIAALTACAENAVVCQEELDNVKALKRWVLNKKKLMADKEMSNLDKESAINGEFDNRISRNKGNDLLGS